jgi:RND family efflux transporter MFP subunit
MITVKNIALITIFTGGVLTTYFLALGKSMSNSSDGEVSSVQVSKVWVEAAKFSDGPMTIASQGTINYRKKVDLAAQVNGEVTKVSKIFVDGEHFSKGDALLQIDPRDYHVAVMREKANLANAKMLLAEEQGRVKQAKREWSDLGNKEANQLFLRTQQHESAKMAVKFAKSSLFKAELDLERASIKSPFEGRVVETYVGVGQYVSVGQKLATIYDVSVANVKLPISLEEMVILHGMTANSLSDTSIQVRLFNRAGEHTIEWQAKVNRIASEVNAGMQTYAVMVDMIEPQPKGFNKDKLPLLPGLFVQAEIYIPPHQDVFKMPRKAVFNGNKILTLDANNMTQMRDVNVLASTDKDVWFNANISENTMVVIQNQYTFMQTTQVEPIFKEQADDVTFAGVAHE